MSTGRGALAETGVDEALAARPLVTNAAMRIALELMLAEVLEAVGRPEDAVRAPTLAEEHGPSPRLRAVTDGHTP